MTRRILARLEQPRKAAERSEFLNPPGGTDGPSSRTRPGHNPTSSQTKDSPRSKTASWCHFHFHEISTCLLFLAQASPFVASFPSAPPFPLQAVAARPIILLMIPKQNFQFSNCPRCLFLRNNSLAHDVLHKQCKPVSFLHVWKSEHLSTVNGVKHRTRIVLH